MIIIYKISKNYWHRIIFKQKILKNQFFAKILILSLFGFVSKSCDIRFFSLINQIKNDFFFDFFQKPLTNYKRIIFFHEQNAQNIIFTKNIIKTKD